jgi:hypothetical protein
MAPQTPGTPQQNHTTDQTQIQPTSYAPQGICTDERAQETSSEDAMMSDLVERLRKRDDDCDMRDLCGLIEEAADEIERLRNLIEECKHNHIMLSQDEYDEFVQALEDT